MGNFELHHLSRELKLILSRFSQSSGMDFALGVFVLLFAVVFLVVGVLRTVEFDGIGFSPLKRRLLISVHVLGVIAASIAMALFGLDNHAVLTSFTGMIAGAAFLLLVPLHIYLALVRRVKQNPLTTLARKAK